MASPTNDTPIVQPDPEPEQEQEQTQEPEQEQGPVQGVSAPDPTLTPTPVLSANVVSDGSALAFLQVQAGDSWESIAEATNTTVEALFELNADLPYFSERSVQVGSYIRVA